MIDIYYYVLLNERRKMYYEEAYFWVDNMEICWLTKVLSEAREKKKELKEKYNEDVVIIKVNLLEVE